MRGQEQWDNGIVMLIVPNPYNGFVLNAEK